MSNSLSISIVTFNPDFALLERSLASLAESIRFAKQQGRLDECHISILDNDTGEGVREALDALVQVTFAGDSAMHAEVIATGANLGYGAANNIAIRAAKSDYHLALNPDVILSSAALDEALRFMENRREIVLLSPAAHGQNGERLFLCKRYPGIWMLFLRGFAPSFLRRRFDRSLRQYELCEETGNDEYAGRFLASGCFMFVRGDALRAAGGFDPAYFLYFEDYDLSLRLARQGTLAFVPAVKIIHHGGGAADKGWRHRFWFLRSALRFFNRHGWRFI